MSGKLELRRFVHATKCLVQSKTHLVECYIGQTGRSMVPSDRSVMHWIEMFFCTISYETIQFLSTPVIVSFESIAKLQDGVRGVQNVTFHEQSWKGSILCAMSNVVFLPSNWVTLGDLFLLSPLRRSFVWPEKSSKTVRLIFQPRTKWLSFRHWLWIPLMRCENSSNIVEKLFMRRRVTTRLKRNGPNYKKHLKL